MQRSKTRARRESRREKLRGSATIALTNPINGDIDCSLVRSYKHRAREIYILRNPLFASLYSRPVVPFLALLYFSFHCTISRYCYRSSSRENSSTFHALTPLPPFLSFALSLSLARFPRGVKGRDPGATVSKYDTGIGYKETINHTRARANGIRTASELTASA